MKRFAVCLLLVAFLLAGCVGGLTTLKSSQDLDTQLSILMARVEKCEPDAEGWKVLEIPCKDPADDAGFKAYKHNERNSFGVTFGVQTLGYDSIADVWFFGSFSYMPVDKETARELLTAWFEMLLERGDLAKAKTFKAEEAQGIKI